MKRGMTVGCLAILLALFAGLGSGTAAAAGTTKLVEGTVYDTTCANVGECGSPCPPPCGPLPAPQARGDFVCAQQRLIVCPLTNSPQTQVICLVRAPCGVSYPVYPGEGAVVTLRKRGSESFLAKIPVVEGHFRVRLSPGAYVVRPYLPEPECWSGGPALLVITPKLKSPVSVPVDVSNTCVASPAAAR